MTRWQHVDGDPCPVGTVKESWAGQWVSPCGCTTPTPDPTSPCARRYLWTTGILDCMWDPNDHPEKSGHPHVPTRCLCGHPIEEAER